MKSIKHSTPTKQQQQQQEQLAGATASLDPIEKSPAAIRTTATSSNINNNSHQLSSVQSMQYKLQT